MFDLSNKIALVTGASKGLGRAIAIKLAEANAHVVLTSRSKSDLQRVQNEIEELGGKATVIRSDMKDHTSIRALFSEVKKEFGQLDILVNNAGATVAKNALDISIEDWNHVMETNVTGLFFSCQEAAKIMKEQSSSRIVNISSVMGAVGDLTISPYVASKGAVIQLSKALALEWARYNITVNTVGPGYIKTDMNREAFNNEKFSNHVLRKIPMRQLGEPDDVAAAVLYLCSDEAKYVTGHSLFVDGGWLAH